MSHGSLLRAMKRSWSNRGSLTKTLTKIQSVHPSDGTVSIVQFDLRYICPQIHLFLLRSEFARSAHSMTRKRFKGAPWEERIENKRVKRKEAYCGHKRLMCLILQQTASSQWRISEVI